MCLSIEEEKDLVKQMPSTLPSSSAAAPLATAVDSPPVPSPAAPAKPMFRLSSCRKCYLLFFCITIYLKLDGSTDTSSTRNQKKWWWPFSLKEYQSRTWMLSLVTRLWVSCSQMNAWLLTESISLCNLTLFTDLFLQLSVVIDVSGEEAYHFQPRLFGKVYIFDKLSCVFFIHAFTKSLFMDGI